MTAADDAAAALETIRSEDARLGPRTTYRVGGSATAVVEVASVSDLEQVAAVIAETGSPVLIVGRGSNLLVSDRGFEGIAVVLGDAFTDLTIVDTTVRAGGMASLPVLARRTAARGLTGMEWCVGVPGSVGGGVRMNAGGHGSDIASTLRHVVVLDLATGVRSTVDRSDLHLGYRRSALASHHLVVEATFQLAHGDAATAKATVAEIVQWRRAHQPGGANAGSVFQNPQDDSAGRLIESAGCKGLRIGSAEVSTKHANFIQVDDDGSAEDVMALMRRVADEVRAACGVELRAETRLVGFPQEAVS